MKKEQNLPTNQDHRPILHILQLAHACVLRLLPLHCCADDFKKLLLLAHPALITIEAKAAAFPLNEGLFPANRLAQINGDDLPPSLQPHYRAFVATTRQSAPLRRIGTFGLAVGAACAFSLRIAV